MKAVAEFFKILNTLIGFTIDKDEKILIPVYIKSRNQTRRNLR
ncbi:hypothetical protein ACOSP6_01340 [Tenacibaculum sp. MEBiC06402]